MAPTVPKRQLFIGGQWVAPVKGGEMPIISPATEAQVGTIAAGTQEDIEKAVAAAQAAIKAGWTKTTGAHRAKYLRAIAEKVGGDCLSS